MPFRTFSKMTGHVLVNFRRLFARTLILRLLCCDTWTKLSRTKIGVALTNSQGTTVSPKPSPSVRNFGREYRHLDLGAKVMQPNNRLEQRVAASVRSGGIE